eukprot:g11207.t1
MGIFGNLFGPDPLASVWEHLHRANVGLANAHHTSRNVPHTGDLAQAIRHGAEAERLVQKRATLEENQRLKRTERGAIGSALQLIMTRKSASSSADRSAGQRRRIEAELRRNQKVWKRTQQELRTKAWLFTQFTAQTQTRREDAEKELWNVIVRSQQWRYNRQEDPRLAAVLASGNLANASAGPGAQSVATRANLVVPAPIASAGAASDLAVSTANGGIASSSAAPAAGPLLRSPEEKDEQEDDNHNVEHGEQRQVVPASSSSSSNKLPPPSEYYGRQEWLESKRFYKYRKCKLQFQAKHAHNGAPQVHGGFLRDSQFAVVDLELVEKEERDRRSSLVVQDVDAVHPEIAAGHHDLLYARKIASWDVKYEKLPKSATDQTIEPVGQGAYGKVYKAKNRLTGELVAAKVTTKLADEEGGANLSFMREVQTMRRLVDCSACVRLVEMAVTDRGEPVIVMEYCHASLSQLLQSEKHSLTMANIKYLMQQVLEGVGYMHALGILHRDLATKNVLFNISGEIKVCDFGLSRVAFGGEERAKNLEPPQFIVTILYRSIELLLGEQNYGPALDIWGVGCILAEILIFKGGVSKKPFFYDESLGNNVNEMTVAAYVFQLLGRPTQKSWPDFPKLLKRCNFENFEAHIRNARPHKEHLVLREDPDSCTTTSSSKATSTAGAGGALALSGGAAKKGGGPTTSNFFSNEALNLKELFTTGGCKQVRAQLFIKESLFHLLGGMLNLDPAFRFTARKSLEDSWFGENPMPTWDAGRFANQVDVVTGAADTTREEKERRALVRMLEEAESTRAAVVDSRELQGPPGAGRAGGSKAKPSIKTAPPGGGAFGSGIPGGGRRNSEGGAAGGAVSAEESPKEIETRGVAVFNELVINDFHAQYGHELRADAFIKLKTESGTPENAAPGGWLAVQVKTTTKRTASWARKMKHVLRYEREGLHNMALVGVSLDPEDPVFIHVVHRCNNYDCFSTKDATWNTTRSSAAARLRELCTSGATPLNESPTSRFVYSQATLIECEAREDFKTLLRGSPVSYEAATTEFTVVDGILSLNGVPGVGYRVQEKVLAWRRENGKPLGLRVCMRRHCPLSLGSTGKNYGPADADYLLLHARDCDPSACAPTRIYGSALIPWRELEAQGEPGRGMLSIYPEGAPGVKTARQGWAETFFHKRSDIVQAISDELTAAQGQIANDM